MERGIEEKQSSEAAKRSTQSQQDWDTIARTEVDLVVNRGKYPPELPEDLSYALIAINQQAEVEHQRPLWKDKAYNYLRTKRSKPEWRDKLMALGLAKTATLAQGLTAKVAAQLQAEAETSQADEILQLGEEDEVASQSSSGSDFIMSDVEVEEEPASSPARPVVVEAIVEAEPDNPSPGEITWHSHVVPKLTSLGFTEEELRNLSPGVETTENQRIVDEQFLIFSQKYPARPLEPVKRKTMVLPRNRKKRRAVQYRLIQRAYIRDRARAAKTVLSGDWKAESEDGAATLEAQESFWRPLLERESIADSRSPDPIREEQWGLIAAIELEDLEMALKASPGKTAAGPDGRTLGQIAKMDRVAVLRQMNLWLVSCCLPSALCEARTTLIPKVLGTTEPSKFRPITVASLLVRLYHRIIAQRLEKLCPCSERQKAFRTGDGIAENVFLVEQLIRDATQRAVPREVYLCFLDVAKAFDSVSHESLLAACRRAGVASPLLSYIGNVYRRSATRLWVNGAKTEPIACKQGVRQGDPLSSMLFNFVIDWALSSLDPQLGADVGKVRVSHAAYADDQVVASGTKTGLQANVNTLVSELGKSGLSLNAAKCMTVALVVDRGRKKSLVDSQSFITIDGKQVPGQKASEYYKYLGLNISKKGSSTTILERVKKQLQELSKAPLKPQQRLYILKANVIPGLTHQLVLGRVYKGFLKHLDCEIRKWVRKWLKFPHDIHLANFYAKVKDGGLGIKSLEFTIPLLKRRRMVRAKCSSDPAIVEATRTMDFEKSYGYWIKPLRTLVPGFPMDDSRSQDMAWGSVLTQSVDGKGLSFAVKCPSVQDWVSDGTSLMEGRKYCAALNLRAGTLPSGERMDRGRNTGRAKCSFPPCGGIEFLGHILQCCDKTYEARIWRHNRLMGKIIKSLKRLKYDYLKEPRIPVVENGVRTTRKPDIVFWSERKGLSVVLDVSVHRDNLETANTGHEAKVAYYDRAEVREWVKRKTKVEPEFSAFAVSWRGIVNPQSEEDLKKYGWSKFHIKLLAVETVESGCYIHRLFQSETTQTRRRRVQRQVNSIP